MSSYKHDVVDIKQRARGRWLDILPELCPALELAAISKGRHVPCPVHGGTDGFRLLKDSATDGMGVCNTCHGSPVDGISLAMWVNNWSLVEALSAIDAALGGTDVARPVARGAAASAAHVDRDTDASDKKRRAAMIQWKQASAEPHEPARLYFERRGLAPVAPSGSIRYHNGLPYFERGRALTDDHGRWKTWPCIVAAMRNAEGCTGLLKIYLTPEGGKACDVPVSKPLFSFAALAGSAVRVHAATDVLAVCEGLETALAVREMHGLPVAACGTAALMRSVEIPSRVKRLCIYADRDDSGAGEGAALALSELAKGRGLDVVIHIPDKIEGLSSVDYMDVLLNSRGCTNTQAVCSGACVNMQRPRSRG